VQTQQSYNGAGNTIEENSSVFFLIQMHLPSVLWHCWLDGTITIIPKVLSVKLRANLTLLTRSLTPSQPNLCLFSSETGTN